VVSPFDVQAATRRFRCQALQISAILGEFAYWSSCFLSLGVRGLDLVYTVVLSWLPIHFVSLRLMKYIAPPANRNSNAPVRWARQLRELKGDKIKSQGRTAPQDRDGADARKTGGYFLLCARPMRAD